MAMAKYCQKTEPNNPKIGVEAAYMAPVGIETENILNSLAYASEYGYTDDECSLLLESTNWRYVPKEEQEMIYTTIINELQRKWIEIPFSYYGNEYRLLDSTSAVHEFVDLFINYSIESRMELREHPSLEDVLHYCIDAGYLLDGTQIVNLARMRESAVEHRYYIIDYVQFPNGGVRYTYANVPPYHPDYDSEVEERTHYHRDRIYSGGYWYPSSASELPEYLIAVDHRFLSKNVWLFIRPLENTTSGRECSVYLWVGPWTDDGTLPFVEETSSNLTFPFEPWARPHVVAHAMTQRAAVDFDISDREEIRILEQAIRDTLLKIAAQFGNILGQKSSKRSRTPNVEDLP